MDWNGISAVLFDLDGTLYHQRPLRRRMLVELAGLPRSAGSLRGALATWRRIQRFRAAREELRGLPEPGEGGRERSLAELEFSRPAERLREPPEVLRATIDEWMHERPLAHLAACRRPDLESFLAFLEERGLERGVFSDYPPHAKLEALGVRRRFSLALAATDPEVDAFKPSPRGFLVACRRWGLTPEEVLYVGDTPHLDGAGARAAGMRCAILGRRPSGFPTFVSLDALRVELARATPEGRE